MRKRLAPTDSVATKLERDKNDKIIREIIENSKSDRCAWDVGNNRGSPK
jgi:hypothetical protein